MSIKSAPYYWIECDQPDCGEKSTEGGDHSAWSDINGAEEDAYNSDWGMADGKHYCPPHIPQPEEIEFQVGPGFVIE
jgi:hypothetical protein